MLLSLPSPSIVMRKRSGALRTPLAGRTVEDEGLDSTACPASGSAAETQSFFIGAARAALVLWWAHDIMRITYLALERP